MRQGGGRIVGAADPAVTHLVAAQPGSPSSSLSQPWALLEALEAECASADGGGGAAMATLRQRLAAGSVQLVASS